ncbi:MAG: gamma-glutamyl-gamma-aminobutyrate hydrolase family protein [Pseudomonadota bacterium]
MTGSPASVHDPLPWIPRLLELIVAAHQKTFPLFGACFGHQAIALALGGRVTRSPGGWSFGLKEMIALDPRAALGLPARLEQHAAHIEEVRVLPKAVRALFEKMAVASAVLHLAITFSRRRTIPKSPQRSWRIW